MQNSMKLCVSGPTHSQLPARASQWTVVVEFSETTVKDSLKSDFSQRNENEALCVCYIGLLCQVSISGFDSVGRP